MQSKSSLPPNRLKDLRLARDVPMYDLAALVRRDPSTIYRWEEGSTPVPDEAKFAFADFYGVSVEYVMGWDTLGDEFPPVAETAGA